MCHCILGRGQDLRTFRQLGSRVPVFAVFLGFFGDRNQFYTANGRWITSLGFSARFTVSNFVTARDLEPVLARIPQNATLEQLEELRSTERGPSREDGKLLINKMTAFRLSSEAIYQAHMTKLDSAQDLIASAKGFDYLSLFDMAAILLPEDLKEGDSFSAPALYAVHTALSRNETALSPLSPSTDCHRQSHLFELFPLNHVQLVAKIATWVREYTEFCAKKLRPPTPGEMDEIVLGRFILEARQAVTTSRGSREWTRHGILKASPGVTLPRVEWSSSSQDVITFLERWASYNLFDSGSRFHSHGALLLRALGLYEDTALDQSTAWLFLQEIGVVAPWEIPSRYKVRFPGTRIARGGGITRRVPRDVTQSTRPDIAAGHRKARAGSATFCIDAPSTVVIDDGISLERTERPDEFWVHVHVADPASVIKPDSEMCKFMELIPENIYLPGHFQAMLPEDLGEDDSGDCGSESLIRQHSLRAGAPALTFSAKVNEAGDLLEYQVEPSTLENVIFLDPADVSAFCGVQTTAPLAQSSALEVGSPPDRLAGHVPQRVMSNTRDLDDASRSDLLTLHRLAEAIKQRRLDRGAWPYFSPRPSVQVLFNEAIPGTGALKNAAVFPADPYIKVSTDPSTDCPVVNTTMVLAGSIAARWCSSRGVPIPYRRDAKSAANFEAAHQYATTEIYPLIRQGIEPSESHRQELARLTGGVQLSTEPGPYFLLGLDMYTKATSPLRRFSDLLVHWQMHAALAHERQTQRRIDAAVDDLDKILPFTKESLGRTTLPLLHMREKMARTVSRGTLDWIHIALVRAWKFEDKAPRTLRFTVSSRWGQGLLGSLDLFNLRAVMDVAGIGGCCLIRDVRIGDEFEVELADVNTHARQIVVKALRYLGKSPPRPAAVPPAFAQERVQSPDAK